MIPKVWHKVATGAVLLLAIAAVTASAVTQNVGPGQVDWSKGTITVTGDGAPPRDASNPAQARLMAERTAMLDAQRKLLETVQGVKISAETEIGEAMASDTVRSKITGMVKNFRQVGRPKYFNDGGVQITLEMPLDPNLKGAVLPDEEGHYNARELPRQANAGGHTGLIVDARGLGLEPALEPRILDPEGNVLYGPEFITRELATDPGVAAYVDSLEAAQSDARAGGNPLTLKAQKATGENRSDAVLSAEEAAKLDPAKTDVSFLSTARVILVIDQ